MTGHRETPPRSQISIYCPAKRFIATRGGRPGGFDRGSRATPQGHRRSVSVHQDDAVRFPKPSLPTQSAKQRVMTPSRIGFEKPAPFDLSLGLQDRHGASRYPRPPDSAAVNLFRQNLPPTGCSETFLHSKTGCSGINNRKSRGSTATPPRRGTPSSPSPSGSSPQTGLS